MKTLHDLSDDEFALLARRAAALPDAPDTLVRAVIDLFPAQASPSIAELARAALTRVVAALAFDSWAPATMAMAVRSLPSDTHQLLFSAMGRDIDVRVTPAASNFSLTGQVLGPDRTGTLEVTDRAADANEVRPHVAHLDELGEFRLDDLPAGTYAVTLRVPDLEIELPPIDVGVRR